MKRTKYPKLLINGRACSVNQKRVEQASGNVFLYWFAYWREDGKQRIKYLGVDDPRTQYPLAPTNEVQA